MITYTYVYTIPVLFTISKYYTIYYLYLVSKIKKAANRSGELRYEIQKIIYQPLSIFTTECVNIKFLIWDYIQVR